MEFFEKVTKPCLDTTRLKKLVTIAGLPELCHSISTVISDENQSGVIYCSWGELEVRRDEIRYGVRFSLPNCPNALSWTITYDEGSKNAVIHCTIDKTEHDEDFIESIQEFMNDWSDGLAQVSSDDTAIESKITAQN